MSAIENLPVDKLNKVDWNVVTEEQAANFGLALGIYNDVVESNQKLKAIYNANLLLFITSTIVYLILAFVFDTIVASVGSFLVLSYVTYRSWRDSLESEKHVKSTLDSLVKDVECLPVE